MFLFGVHPLCGCYDEALTQSVHSKEKRKHAFFHPLDCPGSLASLTASAVKKGEDFLSIRTLPIDPNFTPSLISLGGFVLKFLFNPLVPRTHELSCFLLECIHYVDAMMKH